MSGSVRITMRRFQKLDLRIEKISEPFCRVDIEPDTGCDDNIVIRVTIKRGGEAGNAQGEVDNSVYRAATTKQVGIDHRDIERIGNQSGLNNLAFCSHQNSPSLQTLNETIGRNLLDRSQGGFE